LILKNGNYVVTDFDQSKLVFFFKDKKPDENLSKKVANEVKLIKPHMVAEDKSGNLYIAESGNHRIVRLNSEGKFTGWLGYDGSKLSQWSTTGSPAKSQLIGGFDTPVAVHAYENALIVSEYGIIGCKFSLDGNSLGA